MVTPEALEYLQKKSNVMMNSKKSKTVKLCSQLGEGRGVKLHRPLAPLAIWTCNKKGAPFQQLA